MDAATCTDVTEGAEDYGGARCDEAQSSHHSNRSGSATSSSPRWNGGRSSRDTTTGATDPRGTENIASSSTESLMFQLLGEDPLQSADVTKVMPRDMQRQAPMNQEE